MADSFHKIRDFQDRADQGDTAARAEFHEEYGRTFKRIARHMLRSGGGPPGWKQWDHRAARNDSQRGSPHRDVGEESVRRVAEQIGDAVLARGAPRRSPQVLLDTLVTQ